MIPKEVLAALRVIQIHTARLANAHLQGSYTSSFRGQGLSFQEVRQYHPGDDVRSIDWNVSARMNEPFVKVFTEEREMTVMLVVDCSPSLQFGTVRAQKTHVACEVTALLATSAITHGDRAGLVLGATETEHFVPPKRGQKHVMRLLREILVRASAPRLAVPSFTGESHGLGAATNLRDLLQTLRRLAKRRTIAFVVSDFLADDYAQTLSLAAAKHDIVPVVLEDPRDLELPDVGLVDFEDLESGELVTIDTSSPAVRAHHRETMAKVARQRDALFRRLGLDVAKVRTDGSVVHPLRELFARRARRMHA
ncbi:MAG: DUF58 domain-containing protein [Proteobacteria bacterium]|nr:MAG: DUF58 domain-containing protein [Pseudomonadota bacterium]